MLVCCCCSVTKSCLTLCDPMDSSFAKLALNLTKVSERKSAFWISNELPYTPIWRVLHSLCFLDSGCIRKVHLLILLVKFQFLPLKHWLCASTCGSPHWGLSLTRGYTCRKSKMVPWFSLSHTHTVLYSLIIVYKYFMPFTEDLNTGIYIRPMQTNKVITIDMISIYFYQLRPTITLFPPSYPHSY